MSFKLTTQLMTKIVLWTALWVLLGLLSAPLMAATGEEPRISKSISFINSSATDKNTRDEKLKLTETDIMTPLIKQGFRAESNAMALGVESTVARHALETTIYDASTELISDFNHNGYYHRFSVAIDADTIYQEAYVYARLYLSYQGGPWNHYASSDAYHIYADSGDDMFVVETELADGFEPGYYDIRIELYDADHDEWLISYGPYDDVSLSALPLEDSYHDDSYTSVAGPVETEVVIVGHGHGAMGWWLLVIPVLIIGVRRLTALLNHYIQLESTEGAGTKFSITVPLSA